jgi:hypothetical protein
MERTFIMLGTNYRAEDPRYSASCSAIALDIAASLLESGGAPTIATFRGEELNQRGFDTRETLKPARYKGEIEFGAHIACLCAGKVYDPMVSPIPIPLDEYSATAFLNKVIEVVPGYLTAEYLRRRLP